MGTTNSPDESIAAARRRGRRVVLGTFIAFVLVFIGVSTVEIFNAAFGLGAPVPAAPSGETAQAEGACADGVRALAAAVDQGAAAGITAPDEETAMLRFRSAVDPIWSSRGVSTEATCRLAPRGQDAFAALLRLRRAEEGFLRRQVVEIAPLRRDVSAYLAR